MKKKESEREPMVCYLPGSRHLVYKSFSISKREAQAKAAKTLSVIFNDKGIGPAILTRGLVVVKSKSPEKFRSLAKVAKTVVDYRRANEALELTDEELREIMQKRVAAKKLSAAKKAAKDTTVWCQVCGTPQEKSVNCSECGAPL